ncbi:retrovirus-related Pol polyprotein from transposon opus [Trichonephila clavata]|uniref:Retrovirus-related Pol polyprotein from transposon opus n=1 Tax=Trichonephila clavata TaxID=2740835 RepID=A0A8X6H1F5_TRICU|nr:retrovirus-related Pol polyprotein from transposon opus [Trichonephila clavata]
MHSLSSKYGKRLSDKGQLSKRRAACIRNLEKGKSSACSSSSDTKCDEISTEAVPGTSDKETQPNIDIELNQMPDILNAQQKYQRKNVLQRYKDILRNHPGKAKTKGHSVKVTVDNSPKRLQPYRVPIALQKEVERQINKLIDMDLIDLISESTELQSTTSQENIEIFEPDVSDNNDLTQDANIRTENNAKTNDYQTVRMFCNREHKNYVQKCFYYHKAIPTNLNLMHYPTSKIK